MVLPGGGHVLHLVCDLTIASENAVFGQTGPKVGSFDAGLEPPICQMHWDKRRLGKSGSFVVNMMPMRPNGWDLSIRWCHWTNWKMRQRSGARLFCTAAPMVFAYD